MKITASTLDLDKESFVKTIKLSFAGIVKEAWENAKNEEEEKLWEGDDLGEIVNRVIQVLKKNFIGEGYFRNYVEKVKMYSLALYNLRLVKQKQDTLSKFLKLFTLYWHKSSVSDNIAKEIFFVKFPSPWREMLIRNYVPGGTADSVARRMSYTHNKLSEWYIQATMQRNLKKLRKINKSTPLDYENVALETEIGGEGPFQQRKKKKNRFQPYDQRGGRMKNSWRSPRRRWSRQKARSYKSGQRSRPAKCRYSSQGASSQGRIPAKRTFRRIGQG